MGYFEHSQSVRKELENSSLVSKVREAFQAKFEPFDVGGTINLYAIGELPSGIHVALRAFRPNMPEGMHDLYRQMQNMDIYCKNAEALIENGYRAPNFSVGVVYHQMAGILLEDISKGGSVPIDRLPIYPYGLITENGEEVQVFIDIDCMFEWDASNPLDTSLTVASRTGPLKFFSEGKFIEL